MVENFIFAPIFYVERNLNRKILTDLSHRVFNDNFYQNKFAMHMNNAKARMDVITVSAINAESLYNAALVEVLQSGCNNWLETTNRSPRIFDDSSLF